LGDFLDFLKYKTTSTDTDQSNTAANAVERSLKAKRERGLRFHESIQPRVYALDVRNE
jgi:hypothetical protein